jgi:hypothetical protein
MSGLPEALSLSILIAGALEYAILVRHRKERRSAAEYDELATTLGHQALMRMRLDGGARPHRHWGGFGTRFRY